MVATPEQKSKPAYWGIHEGNKVVFRGTHTECWDELVTKYANRTVQDLRELGIKIARTN